MSTKLRGRPSQTPRGAARRLALHALVALALLSAVGACTDAPPPTKPPPADTFTDERRVKDLLLTQASAWNHGDLEGFCAAYADDALFLSPSGVTQGRAKILARYQKRYGNAADTMGSLTLEVLEIRGRLNAASVAMKWRLSWDPAQKKEPASGLSMVTLFKDTDAAGKATWRIHQDASM